MSENRRKTEGRRLPRSAFKPGQSGNPGGRPRRTPEDYALMAACTAKTSEALETILWLMDQAKKESVRLAAAIWVIERGHGKAVQSTLAKASSLEDATTELLLAMRARLEQGRDQRHLAHAS
jgi:hypothetical protein